MIDDSMAKKRKKSLSPQDKKIVNVFTDLGMPKNLAKTLIYISHVDECRSSDIERGANLRQPEVSVAMQELSKKGWVSRSNKKKEGKGRPIYIYKLESSLFDIAQEFEKQKMVEIRNIKQDLDDLKGLLKDSQIILR